MRKPSLTAAAKVSAVGLTAAALTFSAAGTASANSFSGVHMGNGTIAYNDGKDRFCAKAYDRAGFLSLNVKLTPVDRSRGPVKYVSDDNESAGATCTGLARAYEDTRYKAQSLRFDESAGGWVVVKTYYFWS